MKAYMLLFRNEKTEGGEPPSAEAMEQMVSHWKSWITGIAAQGKYGGTNRLLPEGKTLKPGKVATDGPYAEVKEMIGGYIIVKAASLDEAVELAKSCPNLTCGGSVEVRSVMPIDDDPASETFLQEKAMGV